LFWIIVSFAFGASGVGAVAAFAGAVVWFCG
jgi:hypothetical protein